MRLIQQGKMELYSDNGRPHLLGPGRYWVGSPVKRLVGQISLSDDVIRQPGGCLTIVRVREGSLAVAWDNHDVQVLLPGRHARCSAGFRYVETYDLGQSPIQCGSLKLLTVRAGGVQLVSNHGRLETLEQGRYAVNSAAFSIDKYVTTQQQNVRY